MKRLLVLLIGMGMIGSPAVRAEQPGQGSAVPHESVVVAQAGQGSSPEPATTPAPSSGPPVPLGRILVVGLLVAAALSGSSTTTNSTTTHH